VPVTTCAATGATANTATNANNADLLRSGIHLDSYLMHYPPLLTRMLL
jgi:hypothetical protein